MTINRFAFVALTALVGPIGYYAAKSQADIGNDSAAQPSLVELATEAYKAAHTGYQVKNKTIDDVYSWSRRIMEAEQKKDMKTAAKNHLTRMKELNRRVAALHRNEAGGSIYDLAAINYYVADAEQRADR